MPVSPITTRRAFLGRISACSGALAIGRTFAAAPPVANQTLFDGKSLKGWTPKPRVPLAGPKGAKLPEAELARITAHTGRWVVEDGAIVGGQEPPGSRLGAYLVSDGTFGDFELELEARPDWRVDTGIMIRASAGGGVGIQVLCDHRPGGGIGGFYFNGTGAFLAAPFFLDGETDDAKNLKRLVPSKREQKQPAVPVDSGCDVNDFLKKWRVNEWNHFRIRCVGELPRLTTWINGLQIAELDLAKLKHDLWKPERVHAAISQPGHIAFEVHNNGPTDLFGDDRWASGAVCRWRNIQVKEL